MKDKDHFPNWKTLSESWRAKLRDENYIISEMYSEQWLNAKYDYLNYEDEHYTNNFDSSLEALKASLEDFSYPPPEILLVILDQFNYYLKNKGEITLEEVFFGKPTGRGMYAARKGKDTESLYQDFSQWNELLGSPKPQIDFLLTCSKFKTIGGILDGMEIGGKEIISNSLYGYFNDESKDEDSFLRGYRRWKKSKISS